MQWNDHRRRDIIPIYIYYIHTGWITRIMIKIDGFFSAWNESGEVLISSFDQSDNDVFLSPWTMEQWSIVHRVFENEAFVKNFGIYFNIGRRGTVLNRKTIIRCIHFWNQSCVKEDNFNKMEQPPRTANLN